MLRALMRHIVGTPLHEHRVAGGARPAADDGVPSGSFAWLTAPGGPHADLADDVVDAMRALRAADVLRQRGTVLRTSGGFEVCMDAETGRAVCTLRPATGDAAYVIAYDDERGAGEANIRVAFVTPRGHLRIAFHRGAFGASRPPGGPQRSVAGVVADIQADVLPSLRGRASAGCRRRPSRAARCASSSSDPTTGRRSRRRWRASSPSATRPSPGGS